MMIQSEYRTERTLIALAGPEDAPAVQRHRRANRDHLGPWEPAREESYYSLEACRRTIAAGIEAARTDRGYPLVVFDSARTRVLGTFTFANIVRGVFQACHLGYGVAVDCQGKGLMFEALTRGMGIAFHDLALRRVMANYMPRNQRSARLLERLGFEREGYAREYLCINGAWEDHVLTARIRDR
ncbi:GNAT family N-acetyltransferase [Oleiagrimonas sp. C23AA]|uniref:GNAT family N-acetyltransferase n=1 Tax=Oleiagrimonas sp. C23AA TaxID=2719047 RepID=UPI00141DE446|nr:GNAT family N-acetyltransferase [Oleiagrimonas sp. C23AA]NII09312.1 GNAT family N-acetyltransferase [Oleiagrimonas sp. C23AA]